MKFKAKFVIRLFSIIKLFVFFAIMTVSVNSSATASENTLESVYEIAGLNRTNPLVVHTEIGLCQCISDHEKLRQVLLATGLFYDVQIEQKVGMTHITLSEKWTTIPIFKVNSGGGVQGYTLGVYDPDFWGRRIEIGTQYESLAGAPSLVFWNKLPRLFNSRFFSDIQIWRTQRIRLKYSPTTVEPLLMKALLQKSDRNYLALGYEFKDDFRSRLFIEEQRDLFTTDRIPVDTLNQVSGQIIPAPSKVNSLGLQIDVGSTHQVRHSPVGTLNSLQLKLSSTQDSNQKDFQSFRWELLHYRLYDRFLWGVRFQAGSTSTDLLQFWNYLGGFESIRGYKDNRFATRNFWLGNFEGRYFISEKENFILQSTGFLDLIGIDEQENRIENLHAASAGIGGRVILPKFYRVTIRFDYAQPLIKSDNQKVSFGVQQFF